ncbi:hypothetical protein ANO11243_016290 [Dothideomycetidae sp. 11243]|nr:hypothetical protein ANO11243_016290 [fungal sp. No.11243]
MGQQFLCAKSSSGNFGKPYLGRYRLSKASEKEIRMLVQEPDMLPLDMPFLSRLDIERIEESLSLFGPRTLVFVPYMDHCIERPYLAKAATCAVYITTAIEDIKDKLVKGLGLSGEEREDHLNGPAIDGIDRLINGHDASRWPDCDEADRTLSGLVSYIVKPDDETEPGD